MADINEKIFKWFVFFCVYKGVLSTKMCRDIIKANGGKVDLLLFAETILENNLADKELLQDFINKACQKAKSPFPPPRDILMEVLSETQIKRIVYPVPDVPTEEIDLTRDDIAKLRAGQLPGDDADGNEGDKGE